MATPDIPFRDLKKGYHWRVENLYFCVQNPNDPAMPRRGEMDENGRVYETTASHAAINVLTIVADRVLGGRPPPRRNACHWRP